MQLINFQILPPSIPLWVFAWIFLIIGFIGLLILVVYTKYGRDISVKLSFVTTLTSAIFLGFGFHFILLNLGV
jgi:hypothetical protein